MTAVIVCIGDELLSGVVVNSNAAMIGDLLSRRGVRVVREVSVGDDEDAIVEVLSSAAAAASTVVVTGGLGPTDDDRTRHALARLTGAALVRDEPAVTALRERFARWGREMPDSNLRQADMPAGATAIPNPIGTAPGIRIERQDCVLYAIPGVPREARRMMDEQVLPDLYSRGVVGEAVRTLEISCVGIPEAELGERLADLAASPNPALAFLPSGGQVRLRFVARGTAADELAKLLAEAEATVRQRCGSAVFGTDGQTLEAVVGLLLAGAGLTVATAESCTAGLVAARLASVPGASAYLRGGLVAYHEEVKAHGLGVSRSLIEAAGPVSGEVALEMARGARYALGADLGLSVTCSAGPEPQGGAEVGTTFLAVSGATGAGVVRGLRLPGERQQVCELAATFALDLLRLHLLGERPR